MRATAIATWVIIGLFVVAIIVFDVYALVKGGEAMTISAYLISLSYEQPIVPFILGFAVGMLGGHLFWRVKDKSIRRSDG